MYYSETRVIMGGLAHVPILIFIVNLIKGKFESIAAKEEEVKAEELNASEVKEEEVKAEELNASEVKEEEVKAEELNASEVKEESE